MRPACGSGEQDVVEQQRAIRQIATRGIMLMKADTNMKQPAVSLPSNQSSSHLRLHRHPHLRLHPHPQRHHPQHSHQHPHQHPPHPQQRRSQGSSWAEDLQWTGSVFLLHVIHGPSISMDTMRFHRDHTFSSDHYTGGMG